MVYPIYYSLIDQNYDMTYFDRDTEYLTDRCWRLETHSYNSGQVIQTQEKEATCEFLSKTSAAYISIFIIIL